MLIGRFTRFLAFVLIVLVLAGAVGAGRFLAREDPLQPADAVYVLGGSWIQRWLEAADLYNEHYAPAIVISRGTVEEGERELTRRGVAFPGPGELGRRTMIDHLGVPEAAVTVLTADVDNTAQEADAIKSVVAERHWRRLIVITDRATTRRAGFAMRRALGPDIEIIMRAPRTDPFTPGGWWKSRANFRTVFYEFPKLLAYWAGLKG